MALTLFTIGHGAGSADDFVARCRPAALEAIVDVRTAPGSRRHPHFGRDTMQVWLPAAGMAYGWEPRLGGFRKPQPGSPNVALRNAAFRGYADYMRTPEFSSALDRVLKRAATQRLAVMCAETLWWRCHRRLIADAATTLHGEEVLHIDGRGALTPHRLTGSAHVVDGSLVYTP